MLFYQDLSVDIAYSALRFMDQEDRELGFMYSQDYAPEDFLVYMFFRKLVACSSLIMAKRQCLIDYPYNVHLKYAEDYELALRLAHHYRFKYIDMPLVSYRRHKQNVSNSLEAHCQAELQILSQYSPQHTDSIIQRSHLAHESKILMRGKIFFNMELWTNALIAFEPIPSSAMAKFYIGICYLKLNQFDKAVESFLSSLKLNASNPVRHNNLGAAYWLLNEKEKARIHFHEALKLKKGYLDAQFNLAMQQANAQPKITLKELKKDLLPYQKD